MMTLPIDDVWLTGESLAGVPGQRVPHTDTNSMATGSNGASMTTHNGANGAVPGEHHPASERHHGGSSHSGSNGAPSNGVPSNGVPSNGVPSHGVPSNGHLATGAPATGRERPSFDPRTFDPGPDLPPLPTLRPLPTIKPMGTWPSAAHAPEPEAVAVPDAPPVLDAAPADDAPTSDAHTDGARPDSDALPDAAPAPEPPLTPDAVREPDAALPSEAVREQDAAPAADVALAPEAVPEPDAGASVNPDQTDHSSPEPALIENHQADEPADNPADNSEDHTIRVTGVDGPDLRKIVAGPVAPTSSTAATPIRHRRRAADIDDAPAPAGDINPGRRVLVLGGSGTVGSAIARALAGQGVRVAVHHATRAAEAGQVVADLAGSGHLAVGADLADADAVADLISTVDAQFDGLDVVINAASAGDSVGRPTVVGSSLSEWTDAWTGTLTVDVLGAATVAHAAAAAFIKRGRAGRIILIAAKGRAVDGIPSSVAVATEQAVAVLGAALATELAPYGVGVTVVGSSAASSTGWSPEVLAETVAWLASGPASGLPGAVFNIAG